MTFDEFKAATGETELTEIGFREGVLSVKLEADQIDMLVRIDVPTDTCYVSSHLCGDQRSRTVPCQVRLSKLQGQAAQENGIIIAPAGFVDLMKETRQGINLAYGRRLSETDSIFQVSDGSLLAACVVRSSNSVLVVVEDDL